VTTITGQKIITPDSPCLFCPASVTIWLNGLSFAILSHFCSGSRLWLHFFRVNRSEQPREIIAIRSASAADSHKKNGSLPEDKLPLRLYWDCLPLAILTAACSASGFRANTLMVGGFPRVRLRFFASVPGPQLV